jgi:hypothetical protein
MKAVLEFNYPEDEEKLLYAVKGPQMYKALAISNWQLQMISNTRLILKMP